MDDNEWIDGTQLLENIQPQLASLAGRWQGITRTWFTPGELADESPWTATFRLVLGGRFLLYEYTGSLQNHTLEGVALIGYNQPRQAYEMAWADTFHMGSAIMFSSGGEKGRPFSVQGSYPDPSGGAPWGWRVALELEQVDQLVIRQYIITPQGEEGLGVETIYQRG